MFNTKFDVSLVVRNNGKRFISVDDLIIHLQAALLKNLDTKILIESLIEDLKRMRNS